MTRKRRYVISAAILAACLGIILGVLAMLPPQPGVTKANFDRVKIGMAWAEVDEIFGQAASERSTLGGGLSNLASYGGDHGASAHIDYCDDVVTRKEWIDSTETFVGKLRRWLHLPK
jgi:hypothetical protein